MRICSRCIFIVLCICLHQKSAFADADPDPVILIIDPIATVQGVDDPEDPVDLQIYNLRSFLPRQIFENLSRYKKSIDLKSRFREFEQLRELVSADSKEEFIDSTLALIQYVPDAYLFSSIAKELGTIELQAQVQDLSASLLAHASIHVEVEHILNTSYVQSKIRSLACNLVSQLDRKITCSRDVEVGFSVGFKSQDMVSVTNIPSSAKLGEPHRDDIGLPTILPPDNPDNYFIFQDEVFIDLVSRRSIEITLQYKEIVGIAIRTTAIDESPIERDKNIFRKAYIPGDPVGSALIFYSVQAESRDFFDANSFSIPLFFSYPIASLGKAELAIIKLVGGTNILLPSKIPIVAHKGWDRFNSLEIGESITLGDIKEVEWFGGAGLNFFPLDDLSLGARLLVVFTDYKFDSDFATSIDIDNQIQLFPQLSISYVLGIHP